MPNPDTLPPQVAPAKTSSPKKARKSASKAKSAAKASPVRTSKSAPKAVKTPPKAKSASKVKSSPKATRPRKTVVSVAPVVPAVIAQPTPDGPQVLTRLWDLIQARKGFDPTVSHAARLLGRGRAKVVQKFGEEATECVIEAMLGNPRTLESESADVLYHLLLVWVDAGIDPDSVWATLSQRIQVSEGAAPPGESTKIP